VWHAGAESRSVNMTELMQTAAVMHSKLWIVDDTHLFIGSANMDYRSVCDMVATLAEYCHHRVCLSVCSRSYLRNYMPDLFTVSVHATYVRGLVNLWQRCDTLCTSGLGMTLYT